MSKGLINTNKLFDAVVAARPNATAHDSRMLAPSLAHLPDKDLQARLDQARQRRATRFGRNSSRPGAGSTPGSRGAE